MTKCGKCSAITAKKERCQKEASCEIGCRKFCWIHSEMHDPKNQICVDDVDQYEKEKQRLVRQINGKTKELRQLLEKCNEDIRQILRRM